MERYIDIIGIASGLLAITTPFLPWWIMFSSDYVYGWSLVDPMTPYLLLMGLMPMGLIFYYSQFIMLMGGIIILLSVNSKQKIEVTLGMVFIFVSVLFLTILVFGFFLGFSSVPIMSDITLFSFSEDKIAGFGPGFYLGYAALVGVIIYKRMFKKESLLEVNSKRIEKKKN
ncbi:MAG: hypothetical protein ACFFA0_04870 [Promethearchaeota archaeon]